ncbi:MAG: hypothetical protein M3Y76_03345 [Chloroflexota bacterium]|nr:hypothetical protein [Chloroflexota bacterium]
MGKKMADKALLPYRPFEKALVDQQVVFVRARNIILCALAYLLCLCVSVSPLLHLAGKTFLLSLPTNPILLLWGAWLPNDLHLQPMRLNSIRVTNDIELSLLLALEFGIYAFCAFLVHRLPERGHYKRIFGVITCGALVFGLIYVLTPAMLSRDIFVYAGYGRTIMTYHANPYFVTPSAYPLDSITPYDDWRYATSAYGPVWLIVCSIWASLVGSSPLGYVFAFRLFGLAAHLANIWFVAAILKKMGRSPRTVTLGMLLYAWNPLALLESSQGGHNDTFMVTLMLLGILLSLRAAQHGFARPFHYLPPIIVFTLATLVKFTSTPLLFFFLVLMSRHIYLAHLSDTQFNHTMGWQSLKRIVPKVLLAIVTSGLVALLCCAPFWIYHNISSIIGSFSSPPSAYYAENSLLRVMYDWVKTYGLPAQTSWMYLPVSALSNHTVWNVINLVALLFALSIGAICLWRTPTMHTMILAALATLALLLVVTPWFFSWYVTWLVGLAAIICPSITLQRTRIRQALIAFSLTFSATAFVTYFAAIGDWGGFNWLLMICPPVLVFIAFITYRKKLHLQSSATNCTITPSR